MMDLSNGEIHYLWWYIQGSIMSPFVREKLRRAWGMCERHAWGAIFVESSFRHGYLHGPSVLYEDLMSRALASFQSRGPGRLPRAIHGLRERGPCPMCEMGLGPHSQGMASSQLVERGKDWGLMRDIALRTLPHWRHMLCGKCLGDDSPVRCRHHLVSETSRARGRHQAHMQLVSEILERVSRYCRSFRWEFRGTDTDMDLAGLLAAVGWCSGWRPLLELLEISAGKSSPGFPIGLRA